MREIKFRGKRKDNGDWVYGSLIVDRNHNTCIIDYADHVSESYIWHDVDPESVGQYTGLPDKNGKEIYEGDICKVYIETGAISEKKTGYMFGVVDFNKHKFQITAKRYEETITRVFGEDKIYGYQPDEFYHLENIEIIGNIYETPDLLTT